MRRRASARGSPPPLLAASPTPRGVPCRWIWLASLALLPCARPEAPCCGSGRCVQATREGGYCFGQKNELACHEHAVDERPCTWVARTRRGRAKCLKRKVCAAAARNATGHSPVPAARAAALARAAPPPLVSAAALLLPPPPPFAVTPPRVASSPPSYTLPPPVRADTAPPPRIYTPPRPRLASPPPSLPPAVHTFPSHTPPSVSLPNRLTRVLPPPSPVVSHKVPQAEQSHASPPFNVNFTGASSRPPTISTSPPLPYPLLSLSLLPPPAPSFPSNESSAAAIGATTRSLPPPPATSFPGNESFAVAIGATTQLASLASTRAVPMNNSAELPPEAIARARAPPARSRLVESMPMVGVFAGGSLRQRVGQYLRHAGQYLSTGDKRNVLAQHPVVLIAMAAAMCIASICCLRWSCQQCVSRSGPYRMYTPISSEPFDELDQESFIISDDGDDDICPQARPRPASSAAA
ncbi:hypothetical protein AB1Y20_021548 [Prymnesium parvum]|uniref:Uncharacterized protein n=1 Tax=Prymnesium parvum TaxID=97485 RepID=A0AB34JLX5_PRYPA